MTKKILIIYHSQKGHTQRLAQASYQGVNKESDIEVRQKKALDANLEDVIWADGVILATPEYFGNMCGALKDFFDRTYYHARNIEINKPYALIISCENDGTNAERNVQSIASSYTLKKALDTLIAKDNDHENDLVKADELGQTFAAGLSLGIF
ncbi:MAG TPA: NAD(P)H-dependent oxidoreductase [Chitinophagales bacterium]|nr:NAD(P)H-dependent oxidoreductase [Chitinophagales bacterium]